MICESPGQRPTITVQGNLPLTLDKRISSLLAEARASLLDDQRIDLLRQCIRSKNIPDYRLDWAAFYYMYFPANFVKAYLAATSVLSAKLRRPVSLLDLGCGSGASTCGAVKALLNLGENIESITAVDSSTEQIEAFHKAADPWIKEVSPKSKVHVHIGDIEDYIKGISHSPPSLIVLSYVLSEIEFEKQARLREMLASKFSQSTTTIIVASDPKKRGVLVEQLGEDPFVVPYDLVEIKLEYSKSLSLRNSPKFSDLDIQKKVVNSYFKIWETHNTEGLSSIFTEDCVYSINRRKTLIGLNEIKAYWRHNSKTQKNVTYNFEFSEQTFNSATIRWMAKFDRVDTLDSRILTGLMHLKFQNGKIQHLEEVYAQEKVDAAR